MGGNQNKEHDRIVSEMRKKLEAVGCMTIHLKSYTVRKMGHRIFRIPLSIEKGWPDIISFRPDGMVEFFDIKTGDARLNPYQIKRCDELARRGFRVTIIHGHKAKEVYKWKNKKS